MNGFNFNKIPRTIKYSFLLWMTIVAYYLFDIYIIYPITGKVYNFISPFIIFGVISVALGLLIHPIFILIRKLFNSLNSKFDIIMKLPKILLFILNKTKLLILGVVTYLLDAIFDRDNEINNPINTIDPNRIHESGKPETFTNTEWNMQNMDKNE